MNPSRLMLAAALATLGFAASAQNAALKTYIVQLSDAPAATYSGGVAGLAATAPATTGARINPSATHVRAYLNYLDVKRNGALAQVGNVAVLHRYNITFNGFAARLTAAQAQSLKTSGKVVSVVESEVRKLDTTRTPGFLGISAPGGLWSRLDAASRTVKGDDVIIGMVDSGVWPEDASFGDKLDAQSKPVAYNKAGTQVYGPPPAKWKGICQVGESFTSAMCNNKLIGARFYNTDFLTSGIPIPLEYASPRDGGGHGTHTASTAGGNADVAASINGVGAGVMSGIAPRARLAVYKVCWEATVAANTGCYTADTLKAIEDAVADGVDVINFSISGTKTNFVDPVEIAFLNATAAGVFVAASAGNSGPGNEVAHISPWLTTVAASTHDRYSVASVTLGSSASFSGPSYQSAGVASTPLVRSIDVGVVAYANLTQAEKTALERCYLPADGGTANTALDASKVTGKMVICYRGGNVLVNKAALVKAAGAAAMIIQNVPAIGGTGASNNSLVLQPYVVPTVHLTNASYTAINDYVLAQGNAATASFGPAVAQPNVVAPVMASFSSRGPNKANANILKPDISGPGVDIIAGWLDTSLTQSQHDLMRFGAFTPKANANAIQGTSMSSPHVAGAAALLRQLYPAWSPAAVKSALMTTATTIKLDSGAADPDRLGYGAGHLNPNGAADTPLVYDASPADYGRFLCGLSLTPPAGIGTCGVLGTVQPWNLNLPSLTAASVLSSLTFNRRVTNVSTATKTFVASTSLTGGWTVAVVPASLTLAPGASGNFDVTVTRAGAAIGAWSFGSLTWSDGITQVRSPLSAKAIGFLAPAQVSDVRASGKGTKLFQVTTGVAGTMSVAATGLVPANLNSNKVPAGTTQCYDVTLPADVQLARFQLFNADTQGGAASDLDLVVFAGPGGTGSQVGASEGSNSDEVVTLAAPAAGVYSACVTGFNVPAGGAQYTLSNWVVGQAVGVQSLKASAPSTVYAGGSATIGLGWSVPAGKRYLGNLQYFDDTAALVGSTVVFVDNH